MLSVEDAGPGLPRRCAIISCRGGIGEAPLRSGPHLGLWLIRTIANEIGARIEVAQSALGGARVSLLVPLPEIRPPMAFEGSLRGCRLALIEDDAVMGESLLVRLSLEGADVRWWTSGAEASRSLPAFGPEVVICDIRLPDDGGEALFDRLARHARRRSCS